MTCRYKSLEPEDSNKVDDLELISYKLTDEMERQLNLAKDKSGINYLKDKANYHFFERAKRILAYPPGVYLLYKTYGKVVGTYGSFLDNYDMLGSKARNYSDILVLSALVMIIFKTLFEVSNINEYSREKERQNKLQKTVRKVLTDLDESWRKDGYIDENTPKPWFLRNL